jgi:Ca2+:H+ antiporter
MLKQERTLILSVITAVLFMLFGSRWMANIGDPIWLTGLSIWLFSVVLAAAMAAVRHAEALARHFGEPFGTLILTLAVTSIEVALIANIMLSGDSNPGFARDTMFGVVMIVLNGLVGLSLLLGGLRFNEQQYNLQGANAYMVVIIPLAGLGLILPDFTISTPDKSFTQFQALFLILVSVGLYAAFLLIQTKRHQNYFVAQDNAAMSEQPPAETVFVFQPWVHACLLLGYLLSVIILSEQIAAPIDYSIEKLGAPMALGGFFVAALILAPEALSGIRAALQNNLQRSVNILLGSVVATISLTIPAVLTLGLLTDTHVLLGLPQAETALLAVTLLVSMTTFSSARTNILQGAVHLILFFAYIMLIFQP